MTKKICYPGSISQYAGNDHKYLKFKNLSNIRSPNSKYAETVDAIRAKNSSTDNKPSYLVLKNFNAQIPIGSKINSITVEYKHYVTATTTGKYPNIGVSTLQISNIKKKGSAPKSSNTKKSVKYSSSKFTYSNVNSKNFSLRIDYPANANNNTGKLRIEFIRIIIDYTEPSYAYSWQKISGGNNKEECSINLKMSNSKKNKYNPSNTIEIPEGFSLTGHSGAGTFQKIAPRVYRWVPNFSKGASSATLNMGFGVDVTYNNGATFYDAIFYVGESLRNTNSSFTVRVTDKTVTPGQETDEDDTEHSQYNGTTLEWDGGEQDVEPFIYREDSFNLQLTLSDEVYEELLEIFYQRGISPDGPYFKSSHSGIVIPVFPFRTLNQLKEFGVLVEPYISMEDNETSGFWRLTLDGYDDIFLQWNFHCPPADESIISKPTLMYLKEDDGELSRFGDGITYTAEVFAKVCTEETYVNDWGKNYRLGVFNNRIEDNCTYIMNFYSPDEEINFFVDLPANLTIADNKTLKFKGVGVQIECSDGTILTPDPYDADDSVYFTPDEFLNNFIMRKNKIFDEVTLIVSYNDEWEQTYKLFFNAEKEEVIETIEDTTDYDNLTLNEIYENTFYWSDCPTAPNNFEELTLDFVYDKDYPLIFLFTGDYEQRGDFAHCEFSEITVTETVDYAGREKNRIFLEPLMNIIESVDAPSCIVPAMSATNPIKIYDLPLGEDYGTNEDIAIRGIAITGEIEHNDNLILVASAKTDKTTINRSVLLDEEDSEFTIGGLSDNWGLFTSEIQNMENWEFYLQFQNNDESNDAVISISNLQIVIWIQTVQKQAVTVWIEGQNLAYYGAFVTDLAIPTGMKTDTDYINIKGTDVNDPYVQVVREKEIQLELDVSETCDLSTNTNLLQDLSNLILTERDEYNRPIPKRLETSYRPDVYFEYITTDDFDNSIDIADYTMKVKLIVPAGTAYSKEDVVTGSVGISRGLTPVEPLILIKPSGEDVEIKDEVTNQKFNFNFPAEWEDRLVEIDCPSKRLFLLESELDDEPVDITSNVDLNADWFVLKGEYNFTSINASIKTVTFTERW